MESSMEVEVPPCQVWNRRTVLDEKIFVFVFVEAIEIQPVLGKLACLLPVPLRGKTPDVDKVLLADQSVSPK